MIENSLVNKELLIQYRTDLESLKLWKSIKDIDESDKNSEIYCIKQTALKIDKAFGLLEEDSPITELLEDIRIDTEDYWYNEEQGKLMINVIKQFKFDNYQQELSNFIKENTNWRNKERDFDIYNEIKKGKFLTEIAEEREYDISNISKINKKVQSSINNMKGKFFEIEYEMYLKGLIKFNKCKIVRDGNPGKPDIYIIDNIKQELYVLSLKNLELNKKSFCITKEQLKPELEFAYYKSTFEGYKKVILYMVVFDSLTKKLFIKEIDYRNPSNIII